MQFILKWNDKTQHGGYIHNTWEKVNIFNIKILKNSKKKDKCLFKIKAKGMKKKFPKMESKIL